MSAYLIELRRSPLRWWLLPLIAIDIAVLFGRSGRWWIGVWPEASVIAQIPAFYFGPLFAAIAAFTSGRSARKSFDEDRTPQARSRWAAEATHFLATVTFAIVPYLVGVVVAFVMARPGAGPGGLWPGYVVVGVSLLVGCSAVGHVVGRMFRASMVPPIGAGIGCFLAVAVLGQKTGLLVLTGYPTMQPHATAVLARLVVAGLLALRISAGSDGGE